MQELVPTQSSPGGRAAGADKHFSPAGQKSPDLPAPLVFLPDLGENKLHVLDTDYENYMFLCMENAAAPGQGLACQYLGMCPTWRGAHCGEWAGRWHRGHASRGAGPRVPWVGAGWVLALWVADEGQTRRLKGQVGGEYP